MHVQSDLSEALGFGCKDSGQGLFAFLQHGHSARERLEAERRQTGPYVVGTYFRLHDSAISGYQYFCPGMALCAQLLRLGGLIGKGEETLTSSTHPPLISLARAIIPLIPSLRSAQ